MLKERRMFKFKFSMEDMLEVIISAPSRNIALNEFTERFYDKETDTWSCGRILNVSMA